MENPAPKPWDKPETPTRRFFRAAGLLIAQGFLSWLLFGLLWIVWAIDPENFGNDQVLLTIQEIAKLIMATVSVFLVKKVLAEENVSSLGLKWNRKAIRDFGAGILITFVIVFLEFLFSLVLGIIKVDGYAWQIQTGWAIVGNLLVTFLIFSFVGWSEELVSRGFHLQTIARGTNMFIGVVLSSAIFSWMHRHNPESSPVKYAFLFAAGLLFAYAYRKTGQLWLSIGLHAGWDFFNAVVFYGFPLGDLHIFRLMNISYLSDVEALLFQWFLQFASLIGCVALIKLYGRKVRQ